MQEFWNERYKQKDYIYGTKPNDFLAENVKILKPHSKVLCLSEGEGRNSVYLAKLGFDVEAVDFSAEAKNKAMALAKNCDVKVSYHVADLNDFDLGQNKWDAIISISAHLNSSLRKKLLTNVKNALKQGGILLLEGYNKDQLQRNSGGPKDADMLFASEELTEIFHDFEILHCQNIIRNVTEGTFHNGEASVIQFIGRKASV